MNRLGLIPNPGVVLQSSAGVPSDHYEVAGTAVVGHSGEFPGGGTGCRCFDPGTVPLPRGVGIARGGEASEKGQITGSLVIRHGLSVHGWGAGGRHVLAPARTVPFPGVVQGAAVAATAKHDQE